MIIDIIQTKCKYTDQFITFLVLDRPVEFIYKKIYKEKNNNIYYEALDNDIYDAICYSPGTHDSFGGRIIQFKTESGILTSNGDVWSCAVEQTGLMEIGFASLENLHKSYGFFGGYIKKYKIHHWLKHNKASKNYYKYEKRNNP